MAQAERIKVLVVDDSALVRATLADLLSADPEIELLGCASDPVIAVEKMKEEAPDVILLDIEMPRVDGLTFLEKIMVQHPLPVVICSSMAGAGSENYFRALNLGAVDIIEKPRIGTRQFLEESRILICDTVKAAAQARVRRLGLADSGPRLSTDAVLPLKDHAAKPLQTTEKVIAIGASTGGTEALRFLLPRFPRDCPGMVITQHMPELFTASFAQGLDRLCAIDVREARGGESVLRGQALIAPGNHHLIVRRNGARYQVELKEGPLVNRHRPSVDVLFRSMARYVGCNGLGVLLTGMGDDGARGLLEMKAAGAWTIAQDEASSVVYGMPRVAAQLGAACAVRPLETMVDDILAAVAALGHQEGKLSR